MANFVFNIAKGRVAEFYNRVDTSDPTNSVLVVVVLATTGIDPDATMIDLDTLAAVLGGSNEVTNVGYARIVYDDTDLTPISPDDTNDEMMVAVPDLAFGAISAGDQWKKVLICYDPDSTGGSDADIIPLTAHDYTRTPDGGTITIPNPDGFFVASG